MRIRPPHEGTIQVGAIRVQDAPCPAMVAPPIGFIRLQRRTEVDIRRLQVIAVATVPLPPTDHEVAPRATAEGRLPIGRLHHLLTEVADSRAAEHPVGEATPEPATVLVEAMPAVAAAVVIDSCSYPGTDKRKNAVPI